MKRISKKRQQWLNKRCTRDRIKHSRKSTQKKRENSSKSHVINLPKLLCTTDSEYCKKLYQAIKTMGKSCSLGHRVKLDFSAVKQINPCGFLLLLSEIEYQKKTSLRSNIQARCPRGSNAAQLLTLFGLAKTLGLSSKGNEPKNELVKGWQYIHGTGAEGHKIGTLIQKIRADGKTLPDRLYDVILESLTNVTNHAYPEGTKIPASLQKWWGFAKTIPETNDNPAIVVLVVYDIGSGILNSIYTKGLNASETKLNFFQRMLKVFGVDDRTKLDRKVITEALEQGKSSTKLPFRGKGLPEMREFAMNATAGKISVRTNGIQYIAAANEAKTTISQTRVALRGTMVEWSFELPRLQQGSM